MSITKLQSLSQGTPGNMTGADIAIAVNALIDLVEGGYMIVNHEESSGVAGDTVGDKTRVDRTLNTVKLNTIIGASLSSNTITLPAGTYKINGNSALLSTYVSGVTQGSRIILRNTSDSTDAILGVANMALSDAGERSGCALLLDGSTTIASSKDFKLQTWRDDGNSSDITIGPVNESGVVEVYSTVVIQKIA